MSFLGLCPHEVDPDFDLLISSAEVTPLDRGHIFEHMPDPYDLVSHDSLLSLKGAVLRHAQDVSTSLWLVLLILQHLLMLTAEPQGIPAILEGLAWRRTGTPRLRRVFSQSQGQGS